MDRIEKSKVLYTGLSLLSLAFAILGFYKVKNGIHRNHSEKSSSNSLQSSSSQNDLKYILEKKKIKKKLQELKSMQDLLIQKSINFEIEYVNETNLLTQKCLLQFFSQTNNIFDLSELQDIFERNRKGRRQIFPFTIVYSHNTNPQNIEYSETYYRFVCTFQGEIKYLISKAHKDFAAFLDINYDLIIDSMNYHLGNDPQGSFGFKILTWQSEIRQLLRCQIPLTCDPLQASKVEPIIQYQKKLLKEEKQTLTLMSIKLGIENQQEVQCLPTLLFCFMEDAVHKKFGVQIQQTVLHRTNSSLQSLKADFVSIQKTVMQQILLSVKDSMSN